MGIACSEGTNFGRHEQKVSRVGAAATSWSSVRSFQSLIALGKRISCSQYDTSCHTLGIRGNGNDGLLWHWDSNLVFTWCQWLWSLGDGGTYKSSPVLLSCTCVGDMVSPAMPACCWHWMSCSISAVSIMLPFAVQTVQISLMLFGSQTACIFQDWCDNYLSLKRSWSSGFFPEPRVLLALLVMLMCLPGGVWSQCNTQEVSTVR